MSRYLEGKEGAGKLPLKPQYHVLAVETEKDAIKIGRLLKEDPLYREFDVEEMPIEPKVSRLGGYTKFKLNLS